MTTIIRSDNLNLTTPLDETSGGTGFNTYNTGEILYASAPNTLGKLPMGTNGNFLTSNGTSVNWSPASGGVGSETINVGTVSQTISPDVDYTFINFAPSSSNVEWITNVVATTAVATGSSAVAKDTTGIYITGRCGSSTI